MPIELDKWLSAIVINIDRLSILDRLSCMAVFVKAVDAGSFAAAAAHVGSSPQMVAKQVAYLEARLATRLLNRTTRRQSLTEAGQLFYDRCKEVLAAADNAEALATEFNVAPRGHLRITAPSSFGRHSFMPMVAAFLNDHPEVTISVTLTDRLVDLVEEGFEAALRVGTPDRSSLVAQPLAHYRLLACASPAYLAQRGTPKVPSDLAGHELLGYAYWSRPSERAWTFTRGQESVSVAAKGRMEVNDSSALAAAALDGFGVVLGPEEALMPAIHAGTLVQVLSDYVAPTRPMHLLYALDRRQTPKLRAFIAAVVDRFGDLPGCRNC